jgi:Periplasmic binding protein
MRNDRLRRRISEAGSNPRPGRRGGGGGHGRLVRLGVVGAAALFVAGCGTAAPTGSPSATTSPGPVGRTGRSTPSAVSTASTSARGVSTHRITVVFPVVSLNSLAGQEGFAEDAEFGEQAKAIQLFVKQVNDQGGIHGRMINPIITSFDPTDETQMRALCKTWTEGSPPVFAVLDGLGDWTGEDQLCITQEGRTPFIGAWTTVTDWTDAGSPYLWWTGPDQAAVLQAVVDWGLRAHLLGGQAKVGVIAGDRASDEAALDSTLLPDLRTAGITPIVKTIDANPDDTATTDAQAPLVMQQFRTAGVTSVIPLMPFNVFYPVLQAETDQHYFPKLLLSDYESSIVTSLGLLQVPYAKALNGQEGVTTETLGGIDDDRPQSQGGYDPAVRACWNVWHKAYPQIPPGNQNDFIEEQGPIVGWCQVIHLFATAAKAAGSDLDRRSFVTALSTIKDFPGTWSPVLSYGPDKRYGPTQYQVVQLHINTATGPQCHHGKDRPPEPACWLSVQPWQALPAT